MVDRQDGYQSLFRVDPINDPEITPVSAKSAFELEPKLSSYS